MNADTTPLSGVWKRTLPELAHSVGRPEIIAACDWLHAWFGILATDPERGEEFDRELTAHAADLRAAGVLVTHPQHPERSQGTGFLLACYSATHPASDELHAVFIGQLDRRAAREGKVFCRWRGYVSVHEFDAWRFDDYQRRVKLANTGEKERAA